MQTVFAHFIGRVAEVLLAGVEEIFAPDEQLDKEVANKIIAQNLLKSFKTLISSTTVECCE